MNVVKYCQRKRMRIVGTSVSQSRCVSNEEVGNRSQASMNRGNTRSNQGTVNGIVLLYFKRKMCKIKVHVSFKKSLTEYQYLGVSSRLCLMSCLTKFVQ